MDHPGGNGGYYEALEQAARDLDAALARIRAGQDAGQLTPAQAATERTDVLEAHLARLGRLRAEHLGEGGHGQDRSPDRPQVPDARAAQPGRAGGRPRRQEPAPGPGPGLRP
jgi:hypothetical protein